MKIVVAGGTGFLGRPLVASLAGEGREIAVLTRRPVASSAPGRAVGWSPDGSVGAWASEVDGAQAIVNLAGESIGRRWTAAHKRRILDSRVLATRSLVAAIRQARRPPPVFVSASAVGYYGARGDEPIDEGTPAGTDFLAHVCVRWEAEAQRAAEGGTRVVCLRGGLALERDGGPLPPMIRPFRFGVGGPVGSGRQYLPWIHRSDWIDLVRWLLETEAARGPVNATSPHPVTNAEFARAVGRVLRRPSFIPVPAFAVRLILGEMAETILTGQRALPAKASALGFRFKYARLDDALTALFGSA